MVVEDEYFIRAMIADELRDYGFQVVECCTADEAIDVLNSGADIDVVFTDVRMPGSMDGLALAGIVSAQFPDLTVVLTSSENQRNGFAAVDFVPKPYRPAYVIHLINNLLRGTSKAARR